MSQSAWVVLQLNKLKVERELKQYVNLRQYLWETSLIHKRTEYFYYPSLCDKLTLPFELIQIMLMQTSFEMSERFVHVCDRRCGLLTTACQCDVYLPHPWSILLCRSIFSLQNRDKHEEDISTLFIKDRSIIFLQQMQTFFCTQTNASFQFYKTWSEQVQHVLLKIQEAFNNNTLCLKQKINLNIYTKWKCQPVNFDESCIFTLPERKWEYKTTATEECPATAAWLFRRVPALASSVGPCWPLIWLAAWPRRPPARWTYALAERTGRESAVNLVIFDTTQGAWDLTKHDKVTVQKERGTIIRDNTSWIGID